MKSYLAAAVCMTSTPDVEANLNQAEELIELAVNQGAKLIGLPENFSFLGRDEEKIAQVETIATKSEKFLIRMAQRFQVTILGGGFPTPLEGDRTKAYNTAMLVDANGTALAVITRHTYSMSMYLMVTIIKNQKPSWQGMTYPPYVALKT